ncbi:MAG: BrnT family toxin [Candidatus Eisenbacteria bacterium]|nr:BrnT family toxin [Candidatus Eisenbacteria bacterium]MCC7142674.1 BrnT family toxin [Candidatus Eisenbacteria bacterium]
MQFEWDPVKAARNRRKHGISFHVASTVFDDPLARTFPDPDHSVGEERCLTIGMTSPGVVVVVVHLDRGERVRLISARQATRRERNWYEET